MCVLVCEKQEQEEKMNLCNMCVCVCVCFLMWEVASKLVVQHRRIEGEVRLG